MKQFVSFITATGKRLRENPALRILVYAVIVLALLLVWLNTEAQEVSFIYNEF